MSRLTIKSASRVQTTMEGIYTDMERRIIASPPGICPVDLTSAFLKLCRAQTCGKCVPCRIGLTQIANMLYEVQSNTATMETLEQIRNTARIIEDSADCALGVEAARMILRSLDGCWEDYVEHVQHHHCSSVVTQSIPCVASCPAGVDIPGYVALVEQERYADAVRLIRKDNPLPVACAMICEHPCESRCRRTLLDAPINIRGLKLAAVNFAGTVPAPKCAESTGKRVAIIGGGPSGMEAAIIAAKRGHDVTIFEKADRLGGKLVFSEQVSFKYDLAKFMNYQINLVKKLGIKVVLNTEATPELIEAQKADWVLAAVGANAFVPPIPGTDGPNVMIAEECYKHIDEIGERVVLIGGGEVGCETALALAEKGKKVSIIEMLPELCPETFHLTRGVMLGKMEKCVDMYTGARCTGITTEGVSFVDKDGNEQFVPCDVVVMSSGMRPRQDLAESFRMTAPDFMPIGDCVIAKNVRTATRMAFDAATRI